MQPIKILSLPQTSFNIMMHFFCCKVWTSTTWTISQRPTQHQICQLPSATKRNSIRTVPLIGAAFETVRISQNYTLRTPEIKNQQALWYRTLQSIKIRTTLTPTKAFKQSPPREDIFKIFLQEPLKETWHNNSKNAHRTPVKLDLSARLMWYPHLLRVCVIEIHMDISQGNFCSDSLRKNNSHQVVTWFAQNGSATKYLHAGWHGYNLELLIPMKLQSVKASLKTGWREKFSKPPRETMWRDT